jgi:hypothetical protein
MKRKNPCPYRLWWLPLLLFIYIYIYIHEQLLSKVSSFRNPKYRKVSQVCLSESQNCSHSQTSKLLLCSFSCTRPQRQWTSCSDGLTSRIWEPCYNSEWTNTLTVSGVRTPCYKSLLSVLKRRIRLPRNPPPPTPSYRRSVSFNLSFHSSTYPSIKQVMVMSTRV